VKESSGLGRLLACMQARACMPRVALTSPSYNTCHRKLFYYYYLLLVSGVFLLWWLWCMVCWEIQLRRSRPPQLQWCSFAAPWPRALAVPENLGVACLRIFLHVTIILCAYSS